ncbi:MAG: PfkB family carbohydrate kinase [Verrucomicrobiota bacterium]|nr:PfkB family carbohydrate kinase [Verrucomicrobiota bacterium]
MRLERFHQITSSYPRLRIAIAGDFCLDRYFEIDPARAEVSIETGLEVYNVMRVRCQPGGAGTILNNLAALGVGQIFPIGFYGDDGEGFELRRSLAARRGVDLRHFISSSALNTFTYSKPLVLEAGRSPRELNRLDLKNWKPTDQNVAQQLAKAIRSVAEQVDALIVLDQVDIPETGVITRIVREALGEIAAAHPSLLILADSRRGLGDFPKLGYKMNAQELARMRKMGGALSKTEVQALAKDLSQETGKAVFITMAEQGIIGASPGEMPIHRPALPVRGEIDIVGAGDSVTANLTAALAARGTIAEACELAMLASSVVIHQLGTTGTASVAQMEEFLES